MNLRTKSQKGFTLIELVMVIVILGILAAFALPRFADLGGEAKAATVQGAYGAIRSASAIAHSKCLASSDCDEASDSSTVALEGAGSVEMVYGYPAATAGGIVAAAQINASDYVIGTVSPLTIQAKDAATPATCQVSYTAAANGDTPPVISVNVEGC